MAAKEVLAEIIDYFADSNTTPGDWWAPNEEHTTLGLDWRNADEGRKFWIDLDKDGSVTLFWKKPGGVSVIRFLEDGEKA